MLSSDFSPLLPGPYQKSYSGSEWYKPAEYPLRYHIPVTGIGNIFSSSIRRFPMSTPVMVRRSSISRWVIILPSFSEARQPSALAFSHPAAQILRFYLLPLRLYTYGFFLSTSFSTKNKAKIVWQFFHIISQFITFILKKSRYLPTKPPYGLQKKAWSHKGRSVPSHQCSDPHND